jgi:hypothetical protein
LEKTWVNLKGPVPVFDGDLVMEAGETPKIENIQVNSYGLHLMNGMEGAAINGGHDVAGHMEVEMDMS